jgi:REP element-mobilizing transposase RayT
MTGKLSRRSRRSIRLPGYDYSQPGFYFVTICTHQRKLLFGEIVEGEISLNEAARRINQIHGSIGSRVWQRNYYEHVIRNEAKLNDLRRYINENLARWFGDPENPRNFDLDQ